MLWMSSEMEWSPHFREKKCSPVNVSKHFTGPWKCDDIGQVWDLLAPDYRLLTSFTVVSFSDIIYLGFCHIFRFLSRKEMLDKLSPADQFHENSNKRCLKFCFLLCLFVLRPGKNQAFVGMGGENKNNQPACTPPPAEYGLNNLLCNSFSLSIRLFYRGGGG